MADGEYNIKIKTAGDASGANAVAQSLQKVGKAASESGGRAKSLGADLQSLGSRQNATKDVIEGLDVALRGNGEAIFGVAKAARNLWEVLTVSTPMGRLLQLAIIAGNAFAMFSARLRGTKDAAQEAGKAAEAAATHFDHLVASAGKKGAESAQNFGVALDERLTSIATKADKALANFAPSPKRATSWKTKRWRWKSRA